MFVEEVAAADQAVALGAVVAGAEGLKRPPSWAPE
jgi:hypothetical protein